MDATTVLKERGLSVTSSRLQVYEALHGEALAFSHADLELKFKRKKMDRITLYRVLNDFEEAGLVHKVIDPQGVAHFALCKDGCLHGHHHDHHAHFNCQRCHKMFCLDTDSQLSFKLPRGFKIAGLNTVIYGTCKTCSA